MAIEVRRPRDEEELAAALALRNGERFDEEGIEHLGMEKHLT